MSELNQHVMLASAAGSRMQARDVKIILKDFLV